MERNFIKELAEFTATSTERYFVGNEKDCKENMLHCDLSALSEFLYSFALVPKEETLQVLEKVEGHEQYKKQLITSLLLFTESCERWASIASDLAEATEQTF